MDGQTETLSIYVVEPDEVACERYRVLFAAQGFECVSFQNAEDFLTQYEPQQSALMVLDLSLPEMSGAELQSYMAENGMRLPVIVTASQASVPDAVAAMRAGAFDFIEKPMAEERLMGAVNAAAEMLFKKQPATVSKKIVADRLAKLTDREREVLQHLLQGKLNKEIASELDVSQRTVEGHRSRIREKMNARGVADLIRMVG